MTAAAKFWCENIRFKKGQWLKKKFSAKIISLTYIYLVWY